MSAYKFKMNVVNPDKNIVTISPTLGTWTKWTLWSFGPSVILIGGMAVLGAIGKRQWEADVAENIEDELNLPHD